MLLVHVQQITPRVTYTFKQICKRVLGVDVDFTTKIEAFIAHDGPKLSYGKQPLGNELHCQSVALLFENGLNELSIRVKDWAQTKCFFEVTNQEAALPFDIFAATFYLLSRYEEYLPHVKDHLLRFPATQSLAYKNDFLTQPVVDIWAYKFKAVLLERYPQMHFPKKSMKVFPVFTISQTFAYKNKGVLRVMGGFVLDIWRLQFNRFSERLRVILGFKKDPFDTFDFIASLQKNNKIDAKMLFSQGDYAAHDVNVSHANPSHKAIIKNMADYMHVGLLCSYEAVTNALLLKKEKNRIEQILNRNLESTACLFSKIRLPKAYRNFIELEISKDYSMGYEQNSGFRAGTCTPFLFYDLDYEVQTPLMVYSYCTSYQSNMAKYESDKVPEEINAYLKEIEQVNGTFITVFSNVLFGGSYSQLIWKKVLQNIWSYHMKL